jgi:hypothetical protein
MKFMFITHLGAFGPKLYEFWKCVLKTFAHFEMLKNIEYA